jgi:uncharacterized protein YcsI (UPF0317 family)
MTKHKRKKNREVVLEEDNWALIREVGYYTVYDQDGQWVWETRDDGEQWTRDYAKYWFSISMGYGQSLIEEEDQA